MVHTTIFGQSDLIPSQILVHFGPPTVLWPFLILSTLTVKRKTAKFSHFSANVLSCLSQPISTEFWRVCFLQILASFILPRKRRNSLIKIKGNPPTTGPKNVCAFCSCLRFSWDKHSLVLFEGLAWHERKEWVITSRERREAQVGTGEGGHYERGLFTGGISGISKNSKFHCCRGAGRQVGTQLKGPLVSAIRGLSRTGSQGLFRASDRVFVFSGAGKGGGPLKGPLRGPVFLDEPPQKFPTLEDLPSGHRRKHGLILPRSGDVTQYVRGRIWSG